MDRSAAPWGLSIGRVKGRDEFFERHIYEWKAQPNHKNLAIEVQIAGIWTYRELSF